MIQLIHLRELAYISLFSLAVVGVVGTGPSGSTGSSMIHLPARCPLPLVEGASGSTGSCDPLAGDEPANPPSLSSAGGRDQYQTVPRLTGLTPRATFALLRVPHATPTDSASDLTSAAGFSPAASTSRRKSLASSIAERSCSSTCGLRMALAFISVTPL